jgi:poly(3-hydroxybutyrate) depolymerase
MRHFPIVMPLVPIAAVFAVLGALVAPPEATLRTVRVGDRSHRYLLLAAEGSGPAPAVVLLHGAGDRPGNMIEAWKGLAREKRITLIAPELPLDPSFEDVAPAVFVAAVDDAMAVTPIDPRRVYLFGN